MSENITRRHAIRTGALAALATGVAGLAVPQGAEASSLPPAADAPPSTWLSIGFEPESPREHWHIVKTETASFLRDLAAANTYASMLAEERGDDQAEAFGRFARYAAFCVPWSIRAEHGDDGADVIARDVFRLFAVAYRQVAAQLDF